MIAQWKIYLSTRRGSDVSALALRRNHAVKNNGLFSACVAQQRVLKNKFHVNLKTSEIDIRLLRVRIIINFFVVT